MSGFDLTGLPPEQALALGAEVADMLAAARAEGYQQAATAVRRLHYAIGAWCFDCNRAGAITWIDGDRHRPSRLCTHGLDNECDGCEQPWPCPTEQALDQLAKERTP